MALKRLEFFLVSEPALFIIGANRKKNLQYLPCFDANNFRANTYTVPCGLADNQHKCNELFMSQIKRTTKPNKAREQVIKSVFEEDSPCLG